MKPDWSRWDTCPWCFVKAGEPCVITSSRYPERNGLVSSRLHHPRRLYHMNILILQYKEWS